MKPPLDIPADAADRGGARTSPNSAAFGAAADLSVALLTGGGDKPYVFGLATELIRRNVPVDLIGSDDLDCPEFHTPGVNFLNLRGNQDSSVNFFKKMSRVLAYYARLIRYSATAKPRVFHILWNNKFEIFDRTLLMLHYKALGKKIVLTLHNVNKGKRDSKDSFLNQLTLKIQYRLADYIFVHTEQMKSEVIGGFGVLSDRVGVIPFGINNAVPNTSLPRAEARRQLGIRDGDKTVLFFGNIAPYKGLEYLTGAFHQFLSDRSDMRLIIAGWPKNCESYWRPIREAIQQYVQDGRIILKAEYIRDEETEVYFKAADVLALPYRHIYQSGVLFLGYSFGLPVVAADVGSLKEDIVEGETGFVFAPQDPSELAKCINRYFGSDLYANLSGRREQIQQFARQRHSWETAGEITTYTYTRLLELPSPSHNESAQNKTATTSADVKAPS